MNPETKDKFPINHDNDCVIQRETRYLLSSRLPFNPVKPVISSAVEIPTPQERSSSNYQS
jgi:hypothetical protein